MEIQEARQKLKVLSPLASQLGLMQEQLNQEVDSLTDEQVIDSIKLEEAMNNLTKDDLNNWAVAFLKQTAN